MIPAAGRHRLTGLRVRAAAPLLAKSAVPRRLPAAVLGDAKAAGRLRRYGLEPVELVEVTPSELLHQRSVHCEMLPSTLGAPVEPVDAFFREADGRLDFSVTRGPAYRTLAEDEAAGAPLPDAETAYWRWQVGLREAGINERPDDWIAAKLAHLRRLHRTIAAAGYRYRSLSHYVWVVRPPLLHTRYGYDYRPGGYEIVDGHHRAAIAVHLGLPSLHVLRVRDIARTTPFGIPLERVVRG